MIDVGIPVGLAEIAFLMGVFYYVRYILKEELDEELWKGTIQMVKANSEKEITFIFKDGMELECNI